MPNTITGTIIKIDPTQTMTTKSGNPFQKRTIVIECGHDNNGQFYSNPIPVEFTQDKCAMLDNYRQGQMVNVYINIDGRYYQPKDTYFISLRGYKIEPAQQQMATPQQPAYQPQQYQAQPMPPYQPPYPQQQNPNGAPF